MNAPKLRLAGAPEDTSPGAIPVKQLRCRAGHHRFSIDDWEPPSPVPPGVSVMFASEGRYKLLEPCLSCMAATRVTYTHPGGVIDGHLKTTIVYGQTWVSMGMSQPRGKRLMRDELFGRGKAQLQAFMGRAVTSLADDDSRPPAVPVRFESV